MGVNELLNIYWKEQENYNVIVKCGKGSILLTEIETEAELKVGDEFGRGMEEDSN